MTSIQRDGAPRTPFSDWIRKHPDLESHAFNLSVQDMDLIVHRFSERKEARRTTIVSVHEHVQLVEVKTFNAEMPFAQKDSMTVLDGLLRSASSNGQGRRLPIRIPDTRPGRPGCLRQVRYFGYHVLQMSHDRPDRSERMIWDGRYDLTEAALIEILRFERDPDCPSKYLDTRRHHRLPAKEAHPQLLLVAQS